MQIKNLTPELMVDDMAKSLAFYQESLGFKTITQVPEQGTPFFAIIHKDTIDLMLYNRDHFAAEIPQFTKQTLGGSFALYFDVTDIKNLFTNLKSDTTIIQPLHKTDYGTQEFSCLDPSSYFLIFSQSSENNS